MWLKNSAVRSRNSKRGAALGSPFLCQYNTYQVQYSVRSTSYILIHHIRSSNTRRAAFGPIFCHAIWSAKMSRNSRSVMSIQYGCGLGPAGKVGPTPFHRYLESIYYGHQQILTFREIIVWGRSISIQRFYRQICSPKKNGGATSTPSRTINSRPVGLNHRWRLYKYNPSDVFKMHTDGAWADRGLDQDGNYVHDLNEGKALSFQTFLIYLNDDFEGGSTTFPVDNEGDGETGFLEVQPKQGSVLCFYHGHHPLSQLHEGAVVHSGIKYVARTDVLYELP